MFSHGAFNIEEKSHQIQIQFQDSEILFYATSIHLEFWKQKTCEEKKELKGNLFTKTLSLTKKRKSKLFLLREFFIKPQSNLLLF